MTASPKLLESFDLQGLSLRNRVVMAPLTRARAGQDRIPNELMAEYYAQRASAGLIVAEATTISEQANGWNESPGIYTDAMVEGWKLTTSAVHEKGGKIFLQLWHMGRASHSSFHGGKLPVAPSPVKIDNGDEIYTPLGKQPYEVPRALETAEIPGLIEDYRQAAIGAKAAGFDGIELHAANGYLLDQFLQSKTNHRTDAYGGSVENRSRLLLEVVEAVSTVWDSQRVGVRIAPNGSFNDMGSPDFREQFTHVASQLNRCNLAYLHVVDGLAFGFHGLGEAMTLDEFRAVYDGVLMGNCGYDQGSAEKAIASGQADLIAIGRSFISNPDLVERYANNWPLNEDSDMSTWYGGAGPRGYTDFPRYAA
ncbi:oxidoreductase, FAD/FMN-binding protein [[Synechococcus] sp. NIES-970]|nr:oxidoreductase, FAD/FMN-binding protein [[Synechococcus] sp. NIES-970]